MKFGTQTRAADFLVYEYGNIDQFGKIISLHDGDELRYMLFEDKKNVGHTINVVYNDINFIVFYSADSRVDEISNMWRYYNYKKNPDHYDKHMNELIKIQKNHFTKANKKEIVIDYLFGFEETF